MQDNILEITNLCKSYHGYKALDNLSFRVRRGTFFAFLGENGAGKSTTINIISSCLEKDSGDIVLAGYNLDKDRKKIQSIIGTLFQNSILDDELTVKENLRIKAAFYGIGKNEFVKRLDYLDSKLDLKRILHRRTKNLSGGERRRADIARALVHKPEFLILDEPTTGLDPKTRMMVWNTIFEIQKEEGLTIFLTTHYMEEVLKADEVIILDKGKILAYGTPASLKSKYTSNKLLWYTKRLKKFDLLLEKTSFKFTYLVDYYEIDFANYAILVDFIEKNKDIVTDFEVLKGNMDDVFLTVTGRKLGVNYED